MKQARPALGSWALRSPELCVGMGEGTVQPVGAQQGPRPSLSETQFWKLGCAAFSFRVLSTVGVLSALHTVGVY